jgi:hypothetical protein
VTHRVPRCLVHCQLSQIDAILVSMWSAPRLRPLHWPALQVPGGTLLSLPAMQALVAVPATSVAVAVLCCAYSAVSSSSSDMVDQDAKRDETRNVDALFQGAFGGKESTWSWVQSKPLGEVRQEVKKALCKQMKERGAQLSEEDQRVEDALTAAGEHPTITLDFGTAARQVR